MVESGFEHQAIPALLSVVVVTVGDTVTPYCDTSELRECLQALTNQNNPPQLEIIVPYHKGMAGIGELRAHFPKVKFQHVEQLKRKSTSGGREHHDELRAIGTAATHGEIIAFLEDHVRPASNWAERVVEAHRQNCAVVGGAIENGVQRPLNWAVYYCDLGKYQNPIPAGNSSIASTVNNSYKRAALAAIEPVWREVFNETTVNAALMARGEKIILSPEIIVYQYRSQLKFNIALREFFIWGKSYAKTRRMMITSGKRSLYFILTPLLPAVLLFRMARRVISRGRFGAAFVRAFPLTAIMTVSWSLGEMRGYGA
jgi:hypothetical protein